jgi:tRNA(fMet)-specific endonuclease VapC
MVGVQQECGSLLPNDEATANAYAELKSHLAGKGKLIPENDIWIAASAKSHDLPLLCSDAHFDYLKEVMSVSQV